MVGRGQPRSQGLFPGNEVGKRLGKSIGEDRKIVYRRGKKNRLRRGST